MGKVLINSGGLFFLGIVTTVAVISILLVSVFGGLVLSGKFWSMVLGVGASMAIPTILIMLPILLWIIKHEKTES
jgi:hypothetical protein